MAAIESIGGIQKLDDFVYEVTGNVTVGADIDDVSNSIFRIHGGGLLKFGAGCDTVFNRCQFVEESDATNPGQDNYIGPSADCRFQGGATCAPVFRGCVWVITAIGSARRDFDIASDGSAPQFISDSQGNRCVLKTPIDCVNHFASSSITIDGLIVDSLNPTAIEFNIPPSVNNLQLVDNHFGSTDRHFSVIVANWGGDGTYQIAGLQSRNIALYEYDGPARPNQIVQLIDPIGTIQKSFSNFFPDNPTVQAGDRLGETVGVLEVFRTYSVSAFDPIVGATLANTRLVVVDSDGNIDYDLNLDNGFSDLLFNYSQATQTRDLVAAGDYTRILAKYGFQAAISSVTPEFVSASGIDDGAVLMLPDTGISQANKATVDTYTTIDTLDQLYDREASFSIDRSDRANVGTRLLTASGSQLLLGSTNLTVDSGVSAAFAVSSGTITIKPTTLLGAGSRFTSLSVDSGTLELVQAGTYSSLIGSMGATGEVQVSDGTSNLAGWSFAAGAEINLRAGQTAATVQVDQPQIANITAGAGVTLAAPVVSFARGITGAPVGAAIAIFLRSAPLIANRSQFTLAAGNNLGNGTLVISGTIPADTPSSGFVRVLRDDGAEDRLAYSSRAGDTFTLAGTLPVTYNAGNGCYVGYLDVLGSATGDESVNLQHVVNRACVLVVRLGSGVGRIREIRQNITLSNQDQVIPVAGFADFINTST